MQSADVVDENFADLIYKKLYKKKVITDTLFLCKKVMQSTFIKSIIIELLKMFTDYSP